MTLNGMTFRDPAGCCYVSGDGVFRFVRPGNVAEFEGFLRTRTARDYVTDKRLISARRLTEDEFAGHAECSSFISILAEQPNGAIFEHDRIWFRSYPYEWPPEMLWAAGRLTLDLAIAALTEGYGLKDATPYNVLFRGNEPVFIDALSFERRHPGDAIWKPYAQFVRTFLLPLLASKRWGVRLADVFLTRPDGLEPEEIYRLCGPLEKLKPKLLSLVTIPTWLSRKAQRNAQQFYQQRILADTKKALYILDSALQRLSCALDSLRPPTKRKSTWSDYMATHSYNDPAFSNKEKFVREALAQFKPKRVLDVGANAGHFSFLAAQGGAEVVAIDLDPVCIGDLFFKAKENKLGILPLVVDLAHPSPSVGWRNCECPSFLGRATGAFDGLLMLAFLHHLLVTERVPLEEVLQLAADLTTSLLVIEFIAPQDAMFCLLTRGRAQLHSELDEKSFERACSVHFHIVRSLLLPGTRRTMYCLKRRGNT